MVFFRKWILLSLIAFSKGILAQSFHDNFACGSLPAGMKTDYRDRTTPQLRWSIQDNKQNHLDPARMRIERGEFSRNVLADIDWTLVRYPNHHEALSLLISYSLVADKIYEFQPPECYFNWAREFAPDDVNVLMAQAYYKWRTGRISEAIEVYKNAIEIEPGSGAAFYNLGLVYLEQKDYPNALNCASTAYGLGYPLTALRDKLADAGYVIYVSTPKK